MTAALAIALAASLYAPPFWSRDLAELQRRLADPPAEDPARELFHDLLLLAHCQPLPAIPDDAPDADLRALVRLEAARAARLRDRPAGTIWADLFNGGFFSRGGATLPDADRELVWPLEEERWPDEETRVEPLAWRCGDRLRAVDELAIATEALVARLARTPATRELSSLVAYHRALLLHRRGARDASRAIEHVPSPADPLIRPYFELLRAEVGAVPESEYVRLASIPPLAREPAVRVRAAQALAKAREWRQVVELAAAMEVEDEAARRHLVLLHATALEALGRLDEAGRVARAEFPALRESRDPSIEALRELRLHQLARGREADALEAARALVPDSEAGEILSELAARSLDAGQPRLAARAAEAASRVPGGAHFTRALVLAARAAFELRQRAAFEDAVGDLLAAGPTSPRARFPTARTRAALELARQLVLSLADRPDREWLARADAQFALLAKALPPDAAGELELLREALAGLSADSPTVARAPVAIGHFRIELATDLPTPPRIEINWPEPRSFLAIPVGDGSLRAWFSHEATQIHPRRDPEHAPPR